MDKSVIAYTWFKGNIEGEMFTVVFSDLMKTSCSWEEVFSILMKRYGHASIAQVKCLLNSISMMHVDVQIQYSWVDL